MAKFNGGGLATLVVGSSLFVSSLAGKMPLLGSESYGIPAGAAAVAGGIGILGGAAFMAMSD